MTQPTAADTHKHHRRSRATRARYNRRGTVLAYSLLLMVIMLGMATFAVDYARMQLIKTEMQRSADATARGILESYATKGTTYSTYWQAMLPSNTCNPVDGNSGTPPTVDVTWGVWNSTTNTFTPGSGSPLAVQVTVSRTAQNGNSVPLTFPLINGSSVMRTSCDVWATSIAVLQPAVITNIYVPGTSDLWLAGMPSGASAGDVDSAPNNSPPTISVSPGETITFSATGTENYTNGSAPSTPDGLSNTIVAHMQYGYSTHNGLQNGIQTIVSPESALLGVFITAVAPNTQTPPTAGLNYSSSASQNQNNYGSLQNQQPFFIGDGTTSNSVIQQFVVPRNATRLSLSCFDQTNNSDNLQGYTVVITHQPRVYLVK